MIEFRRAVLAVAALSTAAMLGACGPYGPRGDRGLPPAPEGLTTPNLSSTPPDARRPLKSKAEQEKLKAELLARKPQRRR